jgi:hypothetical protein
MCSRNYYALFPESGPDKANSQGRVSLPCYSFGDDRLCTGCFK